MAISLTPRDLERKKLRDSNGFVDAVRTTDDSLTLKPVRDRTANNYKTVLHEWDLFAQEYSELFPGCRPSPTQAKIAKDFLIFYRRGRQGKGRVDRERKIVDSTAKTFWKNFMTAWQRKTGDHFSKPLRSTILNLIDGGDDNVLDLSKERRPTKNYTLLDFEAVSRQLWQNDWHDYHHELYRWGLHCLQLLHCGTSARAGEFEMNLRFRDIGIYQVWMTDQPQIVFDLRRDKAKGLQDLPREQPEHIPYELVGQPFYYNLVLFIMARVLSAGALRHYKTWADICSMRKPRGRAHLSLGYEDHCLDMPIFPRCYADGSVDERLTSKSLADHALPDAGYRTGFRESLTFHASRREALFKVDNYGYSINERMRFGAHRHQGTYPAAYQSTISTVDGQATFFELERQNQRLHELFRGYSLHRNYNHWPTLPEYRRQQLEESGPAVADEKAVPPVDERGWDMKKRQRLYDQKRQTRERALRSHQTCPPAGFMISDDFPYESDFVYTRKLMPERDRLAENLFKEGSLRDPVGMMIMDDLVRLLQTKKSQTYCRGLNGSFDVCDTCHQQRIGSNRSTWWSHVYRCRKAAAKKVGQFQEFCFPCSRWFSSLASWKHHAAEHLQPSEEMRLLPLKCNIAQFRHTLLRPGFCPECLGGKTADPEVRFRQYTNVSEWKMHVRHHMSLRERGRWACSHPRCANLAAQTTLEELFEHLADIHQIPFTVAERAQVKRDESTHEEGQKKRIYRYVPKTQSTTRPKGDDGFIHRTSASMKQQLEAQITRRSTFELKIPRNIAPPLEVTQGKRLEARDSDEEDSVGARMANYSEMPVIDDSPPPQATRHSEVMSKDTHAPRDCPEAGLNCRDDVSSRGSCHTMPPRAESDNTEGQTLDAVVVPLQPAPAGGKKRQVLDSSSAFGRKKAKSLELLETSCRKRQVNITVEIPPLPVDWWTSKEKGHNSPSVAKGHSLTRRTRGGVVMPLPKKHPSKKRTKTQPTQRPRGRPRGRPREKIRCVRDLPQPCQPPSVDDHCLSPVRFRKRAREAANVILSHQPDQDESASSTMTREWNISDQDGISRPTSEHASLSIPSGGMSSIYVGLRTKIPTTNPTVSPRVLSILGSPDPLTERCWDRPVRQWPEDSPTSPLDEGEFQHDPRVIPHEQLRQMNAHDDCLFSQISPEFAPAISCTSFPTFPIPSAGAGETTGVEAFPELPAPLADTYDFDRYLRSPSPPCVSISEDGHNASHGRTPIDTAKDLCSNIVSQKYHQPKNSEGSTLKHM